MADLLRWCKRSELLAIPPLQWPLAVLLEEMHEEAYARAAPPIPPTDEERLAEDRVGFLFEAYHVECYYWETVELIRKCVHSLLCCLPFARTHAPAARRLLLTGVMALVRPGSVVQCVMGLLVAAAAVVLYSRRKPYASRAVNRLSFVAQANVWLFLLVALLLQVRVDDEPSDSITYNGVVGTLSLSIFLVPPLNRILAAISDDVEADVGAG